MVYRRRTKRCLSVVVLVVFSLWVCSKVSFADDSELLLFLDAEKKAREIKKIIHENASNIWRHMPESFLADYWVTIRIELKKDGELLDARLGTNSSATDPYDVSALSAVIRSLPIDQVRELDRGTFDHYFRNFSLRIKGGDRFPVVEFVEPVSLTSYADKRTSEARLADEAYSAIRKRITAGLWQVGLNTDFYPQITVKIMLNNDGSLREIKMNSVDPDKAEWAKLGSAVSNAAPFFEIRLLSPTTFDEKFSPLELVFGSDNQYNASLVLDSIRLAIIRALRAPRDSEVGSVLLRISLDRKGEVTAIETLESEGSLAYQHAAIRAVYDSAPFSEVELATDIDYYQALKTFSLRFMPK